MRLLALLLLLAAPVGGEASEWKVVGYGPDDSIKFLDFASRKREGERVRFWVKDVPSDKIDVSSAPEPRKSAWLSAISALTKRDYVPPALTDGGPLTREFGAALKEQRAGLVLALTAWEVAVQDVEDYLGLVYFEVDCEKAAYRMLQLSVKRDGVRRTNSEPGPWKYISPDSVMSGVVVFACPPRGRVEGGASPQTL